MPSQPQNSGMWLQYVHVPSSTYYQSRLTCAYKNTDASRSKFKDHSNPSVSTPEHNTSRTTLQFQKRKELTTMARMICGRTGEPAVRKGPWTLEEDLILVGYISQHGEGSWDNLARSAGKTLSGQLTLLVQVAAKT